MELTRKTREMSCKPSIYLRTYVLGLLFIAVVFAPLLLKSVLRRGGVLPLVSDTPKLSNQPAYQQPRSGIESGAALSTLLGTGVAIQRSDSGDRLWSYVAPLDRITDLYGTRNLDSLFWIVPEGDRSRAWLNYVLRSTRPAGQAPHDFEFLKIDRTTFVVSTRCSDLLVRFPSGIGSLVSSDGIVVLPGNSGIEVLSADAGSTLWRMGADLDTWLLASGNLILVASASRIIALDPETGVRRWELPSSRGVRRLHLTGLGFAYADQTQSLHFADTQTGTLKWSSDPAHHLAFSDDTTVLLYSAATEPKGGKVLAHFASHDLSTGALQWRWKGKDPVWGHASFSVFSTQGVVAISYAYDTNTGSAAPPFSGRVITFVSLQTGKSVAELTLPTGIGSIFWTQNVLTIISGNGVTTLYRLIGNRLEPVKDYGLLDIEVCPARARVFWENEYIGTGTRLRINLPAGNYTIRAECQLYSDAVQTTDIMAEGASSIRLELEPDIGIPWGGNSGNTRR
jgi:hypothetical protein